MGILDGAVECKETEVWKRETSENPFQSYASIKVSDDNRRMTLCLGGACCCMTIEHWHVLAMENCRDLENWKIKGVEGIDAKNNLLSGD